MARSMQESKPVIAGRGRVGLEHLMGSMQETCLSAPSINVGFGQVNFAQEVGKLNTRQAEFEGLL